MAQLDGALRELGGLDLLARQDSPIHRLDPRSKVLTTAVFIIAVVSYGKYELTALLPLALFPVTLAVLGKTPLRFIARKLLLASPFAIMVGIFNPLFDTAAMAEIAGASINAGWFSFASILLRYVLTVSAALALISTSGFDVVCHALTRLWLPRVLAVQLMLLYRYIFVLAGEALRVRRAWALRASRARMSLHIFRLLVGQLLLRAIDRAQRIHLAMVSRGFSGEIKMLRTLKFRLSDALFVAVWVCYFLLVRAVDVPEWLGRAAMGVFV